MSKKDRDVDIIYDYLVEGYSQQKIADNYGMNQREISNILTKDYGLNSGNTPWGTGVNNQKGKYSYLSYEDIEKFVYSGVKDIDNWLSNNLEDSYEDETYEDETYNDNNDFDLHNRTQYSYQRDFNISDDDGRFFRKIAVLSFIIILIVSFIKKGLEILPIYLTLLWNGGYIFIMFGLAIIHILIKLFISHYYFSVIFEEASFYYSLGLGFIIAGIKMLFDFSFEMLWPGMIPIIIGIGLIVIIRWLDNNY